MSRIFFSLQCNFFFPLHLCCMQFFSSDKPLQEFIFQNHPPPPPPPQELNGRPLKTDRPVFRSYFRKKKKGCPCKKHEDFCNASCKCLMTSKKWMKERNARTYANAYGFILVQCRYLAASTFLITHGSKSREAPSNLRT